MHSAYSHTVDSPRACPTSPWPRRGTWTSPHLAAYTVCICVPWICLANRYWQVICLYSLTEHLCLQLTQKELPSSRGTYSPTRRFGPTQGWFFVCRPSLTFQSRPNIGAGDLCFHSLAIIACLTAQLLPVHHPLQYHPQQHSCPLRQHLGSIPAYTCLPTAPTTTSLPTLSRERPLLLNCQIRTPRTTQVAPLIVILVLSPVRSPVQSSPYVYISSWFCSMSDPFSHGSIYQMVTLSKPA